jgi:hypothetical protein
MSWDGTAGDGSPVPDGRYRIEVTAEDGPESVARTVDLVVDRTLGDVSARPSAISPNGDRRADGLRIRYALTRAATVRVEIRRQGKVLRRLVRPVSQGIGSYVVPWDGLAKGVRAPDGSATAVVLARTSLGTRKLTRAVRVDTRPPVVRVRSLRMSRGVSHLRFWLSETAEVTIWYGRDTWRDGRSFVQDRSGGENYIRRRVRGKVVRILGVDATFNRGVPVVARTPR